MKVACYSCFTFASLGRARILFGSLRKFHPEWELVAVIVDEPPAFFEFRPEGEPFDRIEYAASAGIENFDGWVFLHDPLSACAVMEGLFMLRACASGADVVIYIDSDMCLFDELTPIVSMLGSADVVLAIENDFSFCAIRTTDCGARFAEWLSDQSRPGSFDRVKVLRDPGYHIESRSPDSLVKFHYDGSITVDGSPLRIWRFSNVDGKRLSAENFRVDEIRNWYKRRLSEEATGIPSDYWAYACYDDGTPIRRHHRLLYAANEQLRKRFPQPFATGANSYHSWLVESGKFEDAQ